MPRPPRGLQAQGDVWPRPPLPHIHTLPAFGHPPVAPQHSEGVQRPPRPRPTHLEHEIAKQRSAPGAPTTCVMRQSNA